MMSDAFDETARLLRKHCGVANRQLWQWTPPAMSHKPDFPARCTCGSCQNYLSELCWEHHGLECTNTKSWRLSLKPGAPVRVAYPNCRWSHRRCNPEVLLNAVKLASSSNSDCHSKGVCSEVLASLRTNDRLHVTQARHCWCWVQREALVSQRFR